MAQKWVGRGVLVVLAIVAALLAVKALAPRCATDLNCTDSGARFCLNGKCVECRDDVGCDSEMSGLACDPSSHTCVPVECTTDFSCPDEKKCDLSTYKCVDRRLVL